MSQEKRTALESQPPHIAHAGTSHTSDDSSGVGPDRPTPEVLHPRAHTGTDAAAAAAADAEEEEALRAEEATAVAAVDKAAAAAEVQAAQAVVVAAAATWREDADEPQVNRHVCHGANGHDTIGHHLVEVECLMHWRHG